MEENKEVTLIHFEAVSKFKSVRRAINRGHVSIYGVIYPKRPFNNRSSKNGTRYNNELKKSIYEQFTKREN